LGGTDEKVIVEVYPVDQLGVAQAQFEKQKQVNKKYFHYLLLE